ncbi:MAG: hypothetical protein ACK5NC_15015 [Vibrio sp.]
MRWRVQDKILNEQRYFSFKDFGSQEAALEAAQKYQADLDRRRKIRLARHELSHNKLFDKDGMIKGMRIGQRDGIPLLIAQVTYNGKQRKNTRRLTTHSLYQAYDQLCAWVMEIKEIEPDVYLRMDIKKSFFLFRNMTKNQF